MGLPLLAGSYEDSYYTHLRVAQELLLAYEMAPQNLTDGELNIPESGNGVPDIRVGQGSGGGLCLGTTKHPS